MDGWLVGDGIFKGQQSPAEFINARALVVSLRDSVDMSGCGKIETLPPPQLPPFGPRLPFRQCHCPGRNRSPRCWFITTTGPWSGGDVKLIWLVWALRVDLSTHQFAQLARKLLLFQPVLHWMVPCFPVLLVPPFCSDRLGCRNVQRQPDAIFSRD